VSTPLGKTAESQREKTLRKGVEHPALARRELGHLDRALRRLMPAPVAPRAYRGAEPAQRVSAARTRATASSGRCNTSCAGKRTTRHPSRARARSRRASAARGEGAQGVGRGARDGVASAGAVAARVLLFGAAEVRAEEHELTRDLRRRGAVAHAE
jgi:hypothetical protein